MKAHLGGDVLEPSRLEVASPHPVFERAEHVLDRSSSDPHGVGHAVEPGLHGLDDVLVFPALDAPLLAGGAVAL